jgi:phage-related protein
MKRVEFLGSSRRDLRAFPEEARHDAGTQLGRVQWGRDPKDWKPMPSIGIGVREIRIRDTAGAFRIVYTAVFSETVYVLHAFQKKSRATALQDVRLAAARFKALVRERQP